MITAEFFRSKGTFIGFHIFGHADYEAFGKDIVCAMVSSAAYMTANTITDIMDIPAEAKAEEGDMFVMAKCEDAERCQDLLKGLRLHMDNIAEQYEKNLRVIITEV